MMIEVQEWRMPDPPELEETPTDRQWRELTAEMRSFPDCPHCEAPPRPQRHGFSYAQGSRPHSEVWEMNCECGTQLEYERLEVGHVALIGWRFGT